MCPSVCLVTPRRPAAPSAISPRRQLPAMWPGGRRRQLWRRWAGAAPVGGCPRRQIVQQWRPSPFHNGFSAVTTHQLSPISYHSLVAIRQPSAFRHQLSDQTPGNSSATSHQPARPPQPAEVLSGRVLALVGPPGSSGDPNPPSSCPVPSRLCLVPPRSASSRPLQSVCVCR